jgi:hypothetical protein
LFLFVDFGFIWWFDRLRSVGRSNVRGEVAWPDDLTSHGTVGLSLAWP